MEKIRSYFKTHVQSQILTRGLNAYPSISDADCLTTRFADDPEALFHLLEGFRKPLHVPRRITEAFPIATENEPCSLCHIPMDSEARVLPCDHSYHFRCLTFLFIHTDECVICKTVIETDHCVSTVERILRYHILKLISRTLLKHHPHFVKPCPSFVWTLPCRFYMKHLIRTLPTIRSEFEQARAQQRHCLLCGSAIQKKPSVLWLSCMHLYHEDCLRLWFRYEATCPQCSPVQRSGALAIGSKYAWPRRRTHAPPSSRGNEFPPAERNSDHTLR